MTVFVKAAAASFPGRVIDNTFFGDGLSNTQNPMFSGTKERRHIERQNMASDLIAEACQHILVEVGLDAKREIDILITNVAIPDEMFNGCGAVVAKKARLNVRWIYDLHNTGCASFLFMMDLAQLIMNAQGARTAMICSVQTAGGRLFAHQTIRKKVQAKIPGDGCGVVYLTHTGGGGRILASALENFPEYAEDMYMSFDDGRKYWEPGESPGYFAFDDDKIAHVMERGNRLVPQMVRKVCAKAQVKVEDIDYLITNQPNLHFLHNWCEALHLREEQLLHSFERYANLFGAAVPINLAESLDNGTIQPGHLVCLAGFSHAGDFAGATLLQF